ncbi:hypothetical protein FEM48_Zijuj11G0144800 [Ziziphus jujuba var. spinosa]|uniref:Uncharacterized protein n=1 Tax=Ziziphus jujuba var. spinosa TaxID=714518 RepID=A0A978UJH1_ZIZJJ|nr:hypothetical protein FEM48_Zijuj11G0144800 [Ziziphus jujuba var. spinosa]
MDWKIQLILEEYSQAEEHVDDLGFTIMHFVIRYSSADDEIFSYQRGTKITKADVRILLSNRSAHRHHSLHGGVYLSGRIQSVHRPSDIPSRPFLCGFHGHGLSVRRQLSHIIGDVHLHPQLSFQASRFLAVSPLKAYAGIRLPVFCCGGDHASFLCHCNSDRSYEEALTTTIICGVAFVPVTVFALLQFPFYER